MYFPIMIELENRKVAIIGGGKVAYRKALKFLEFNGDITIISPEIIDEFKNLDIKIVYKDYKKEYIDGFDLVIAATNNKKLNLEISRDCEDKKILFNNSDSNRSDFVLPSIINSEGLIVSTSTNGRFPTLSKMVREDFEEKYKKYDDEFLDNLEVLRKIVLEKDRENSKKIFKNALELDNEKLLDLINSYGEINED